MIPAMSRTHWLLICAALVASCRACDEDEPKPATTEPVGAPDADVSAASLPGQPTVDPNAPPRGGPGQVIKRSERGKVGPKVHQVILKDNQFTPSAIQIKVGDTVRWVTEDSGRKHYVIEGEPGSASSLFVSPYLSAGDKTSWSYTFDRAGTFIYHCKEHPGTMRGAKVIVE